MSRFNSLLLACAAVAAAPGQNTFSRAAATPWGQGVALALGDVTRDGTQDMLVVAIDGDMFNYRIYRNLQANGTPTGTGPTIFQPLNLPALGKRGVGAALGCGSRIEQSDMSAHQSLMSPDARPQVFVDKVLVQASAPPYRMQDAKHASWEGRRTRVRPREGAS